MKKVHDIVGASIIDLSASCLESSVKMLYTECVTPFPKARSRMSDFAATPHRPDFEASNHTPKSADLRRRLISGNDDYSPHGVRLTSLWSAQPHEAIKVNPTFDSDKVTVDERPTGSVKIVQTLEDRHIATNGLACLNIPKMVMRSREVPMYH